MSSGNVLNFSSKDFPMNDVSEIYDEIPQYSYLPDSIRESASIHNIKNTYSNDNSQIFKNAAHRMLPEETEVGHVHDNLVVIWMVAACVVFFALYGLGFFAPAISLCMGFVVGFMWYFANKHSSMPKNKQKI